MPKFLMLDEVLLIHQDQISRYGGRPGIRDLNLLKSALAMPQAGFGEEYFHEDPVEMAAAYLYYIIQNHPFIDGNKRTGLVAALVFLALHGIEINAAELELENLIWGVAQGKVKKAEVREFLNSNKVK